LNEMNGAGRGRRSKSASKPVGNRFSYSVRWNEHEKKNPEPRSLIMERKKNKRLP